MAFKSCPRYTTSLAPLAPLHHLLFTNAKVLTFNVCVVCRNKQYQNLFPVIWVGLSLFITLAEANWLLASVTYSLYKYESEIDFLIQLFAIYYFQRQFSLFF